ncbi:MAG TPA: hypothetical protein VGL72_17480 [Bryobacteraceae bacterium]|jgi:hypothetical protein
MSKELDIATGARHIFVRTGNRVQLRLDWPSHLVALLPDDFTLTLSGPDIPRQDKTKSDGTSDDDLLQFAFEWEDKTRSAQLEASGNGQNVVLWRQQVIGDLTTQINWEDRLRPVLNEPVSPDIDGEPAGGGTIPDDLRSEELRSLEQNDDSDDESSAAPGSDSQDSTSEDSDNQNSESPDVGSQTPPDNSQDGDSQ